MAFAEDFEESLLANVQDGGLAFHRNALLFRKERNQLRKGSQRMITHKAISKAIAT